MGAEESCTQKTVKSAVVGGLVGAFHSLSHGWWFSLNARSTLKDLAFRSPLYAGMGTVYFATLCNLPSIRGTDDHLNAGIAGACAGALWGLRGPNVASLALTVVGFGVTTAFIDWCTAEQYALRNKSLDDRIEEQRNGFFKYPQRDPFERKWKKIQEREQL